MSLQLLALQLRATNSKVRLPWFRVHIVILNDPGRLISVHIMHTGLLAGWSGVMTLYELIIFDPTDPVYNPSWRQGCYLMPFISRIGVVSSLYNWSLGITLPQSGMWTYETVSAAHICLACLLMSSAFWHWAYWDLDVFVQSSSGSLVLDLNKIFGIHLFLASLLCFGFGYGHLTGAFGPGICGSIRNLKPVYSVIRITPYCYGVLSSHHIVAGFAGSFVGIFHISGRPGPLLYKLNRMGNIESVLSSSISAVFFAAWVTSALMWYSSVVTALELNGPSRYHWDNSLFAQDIERRVLQVPSVFVNKAWEQVPDKLVLYDYIGSNPSKGGLFRSGPMLKGDGIVQNWLGHPNFEMGTLSLAVRRMAAFFETFPLILIDQGGALRADIPFRRAESLNSIEQTSVVLYFSGGILNGLEYATPSLVKGYARKAQFGEIFTFDFKTSRADGVWRTSPRGWYSFSHVVLAFLFFFGHLWHAGRAVFRDLTTGVTVSQLEYGLFEKLCSVQ